MSSLNVINNEDRVPPKKNKKKLEILDENTPYTLESKSTTDVLSEPVDISSKKKYTDILRYMLSNASYEEVMDSTSTHRPRIFEALVILLGISKILDFNGSAQAGNYAGNTLSNLTDIRDVLCKSISQGGDKSDFTTINNDCIYPVSVKYGDNVGPDGSDIQKIHGIGKDKYPNKTIKPYLIVKNKLQITEHTYHLGSATIRDIHKELEQDKRILDEQDIKNAYIKFQQTFKGMSLPDYIEKINADVLLNKRIWLQKRLHQQMTSQSIQNKITQGLSYRFIIGHKPRSGKSITMLMLLSELIKMGRVKRALFLTPVPETIEDYIKTIHQYLDFELIKNSRRIDKDGLDKEIDINFTGIIFGSIQFLKMDKSDKKSDWLKLYNPDAIVLDESQHGGSTKTTNKKIFKKIMKSSTSEQLIFYLSGTFNKTKMFYGIKNTEIYPWTFIDESYMKKIDDPTIRSIMEEKHGPLITSCMSDVTIDSNYSRCPIPILHRPELPKDFENAINTYNQENGTTLGFSMSCILALEEKPKSKKGASKYIPKFQLSKTASGTKLLKAVLCWFISKDPNARTIMRDVMETQSNWSSRQTSNDAPLVHIIFLPKVGSIENLQFALENFIKTEDIWSDYKVVHSNCKNKSDDMSQLNLTKYVDKQLEMTKSEKKDGLIILLGDQGSLAITLKKCDVLFMLDDSINLEYYLQRIMRCMTEDEKKTIGCIVDLNVQRTLLFVKSMCRMVSKDASISTSLYKLIELNIFHFNPKLYNYGNTNKSDISKICDDIDNVIVRGLKEESILQECIGIKCDGLEILLRNKTDGKKGTKKNTLIVNTEGLGGLNPDLVKPGKTIVGTIIGEEGGDGSDGSDDDDAAAAAADDDDDDDDDDEKEHTKSKTDLFFSKCICLLSLLTLSNSCNTLLSMHDSLIPNRKELFKTLVLKDIEIISSSSTDLNVCCVEYSSAMSHVFTLGTQYSDVVEDIKQIYSNAKGPELRLLVQAHFKPSLEEKNGNAEIPTPDILAEEMNKPVPSVFWTTPRKILEPGCGKGVFVLAIFDKFYHGLAESVPDEEERCNIILKQCIYFADINKLNVVITTILLECHAQSYCGIKPEYEFNSYVGDTLELNIKDTWNITGFDAVIGNPPYQAVDANGRSKGGGNNLYTKFIYFADSVLNPGGYMLFINPPSFFGIGRSNNKDDMSVRKDIFEKYYYCFINLEECSKHFKVGSKFVYYLIQKKNEVNTQLQVICKYKKNVYNSVIDQNIMNNMEYLPYLLTNESIQILHKIKSLAEVKLNIFHSPDNRGDKVHVKDTQTEVYKYPIQATGTQILYSSKVCKNQYDKKVLMSRSGYLKPIYDDGVLGVGGDCFACLVKDEEEGRYIIKLLNSKLYTFYIEINKWSGFHHKSVLCDLPHITMPANFTDSDMYNYFKINANEIVIINNNT